MKITLKRTKAASQTRLITGRMAYFPANYDILADGEKVGEMQGFSQTRLKDGTHGHRAIVRGVRLSRAGMRGIDREIMEREILEQLNPKQ